MKPLEGIRVLDLTQFLSGPFCTMILSDMGAEVIKLERPLTGDMTRYSPLTRDMTSTYFVSCNRGKKSVLMDLKDPRQKEIFFDMIRDADVLVENYKPGTMKKFGCDYPVLKEINPSLIYTAISGFGQTGPWAKKGALDLVIQAMSGLMSVTGELGGEPQKCGTSISDIISGIYGAVGTLAALYSRSQDGKGQMVDVAMLDSTVAVLESAIARYFVSGVVPGPIGNRHAAGAPFQPFPTKDGNSVFICCPADDQWQRLCDGLGHPEWKEDERFFTTASRKENEKPLEVMMTEATLQWTSEDLCEMLEQNNIVNGQINNIAQVVKHPQIQAREMIVNIEYPNAQPFQTTGSPIKFSSYENDTTYQAAQLGADTLDILRKYASDTLLQDIYGPIFPKVTEAVNHKFGK